MEKIFELHKPIRNRIRKYDRDELLTIAMFVLHEDEEDFAKKARYLPWECMLLIGWILLYGEPNHKAKKPTINVINSLINDIKQLHDEGLPLNLSNPHGLHKFMRRTAFQQFTYQMPIWEMGLRAGRQLILFEDLGKPYDITGRFYRATGLTVTDFLSITFSVFALIMQPNVKSVKISDLVPTFDPLLLDKYFKLVSVTRDEAKKFLETQTKLNGNRFILHLYQLSPLVHKPFWSTPILESGFRV